VERTFDHIRTTVCVNRDGRRVSRQEAQDAQAHDRFVLLVHFVVRMFPFNRA
jgi:hypothetical protein